MSFIFNPTTDQWWVPPARQDGWGDLPPGYEWYWNQLTLRWETRQKPVLTTTAGTITLPSMARRETIEYTHDFDGAGSSSIKHVYWNANTERLTVQFVGRGTYSYDGVEWALFEDFESADSLGKFFTGTFTPRGEDKWPGAKHDERLIDFTQVETVPDDETHELPDVDALKPTAITRGKGKEYDLSFTFAGRGKMKVRASDAHDAIQTFMEHMAREGFTVTRVEATE